ncbi:protein kinase [Stigmatella sp. ncwal1]|uniref:Protein kinase n=1 Tax=Stigmatella ashevillensis TaxID=2995309 RepID=A0ABT5DLX3_9BACT|nr:serine/threonine-protein kinase [Stigmatella ashevillena]MDC0714531.1 protein kinase [Stigmatella ashevillena]
MEHPDLGPYRILGVLGRGGMGQVFRGQHRESGQLAALKTVHAPSSLYLSSLRREVRALGQVRHSGLVRILDQGIDEGRPWYAMELLLGRTLRDVLAGDPRAPEGGEPTLPTEGAAALPPRSEDGATAPPPLARAFSLLGLLRDVCAPLAALHSAGLVHRDLKPENIFVTGHGVPVLVDLGIAARFGGATGRESFTSGEELQAIGTRPYMAPEQLRGELVDARADLYALGTILYECLTGQRPFTSASPGAVLARRPGQRPIAPSQLVLGIPPELDSLVLRLLEPRPRDRLGYAEDVAGLLEQALCGWEHVPPRRSEPWERSPPANRSSTPRARPWLYRPDFTGREHVADRLAAAVDQLRREGRGGRIYIGGESGVGKTRLVMELARRAMGQGLRVASCPCRPGDAPGAEPIPSAPLHPFRPLLLALADRCRAGGSPVTAELLGPAGRVLAPYEPSLMEAPGLEHYPELPPLDATSTRLRLFDALASALLAFTGHGPLVLVLDDLQWADELSLGFLRSIGHGPLAEAPVLILGTYRSGAPGGPLVSVIEAAGGSQVELGQLDDASVRTMASSMLALPEVPADIGGFLAAAAEGNPFLVAEYLRAAIEAGVLVREPDGQWRFLPSEAPGVTVPSLPRSLDELISGRMSSLGRAEQAVLDAAAVLGHSLEEDLLARLAGLEESEASDAVQSLCLRAILEQEGRLCFVQERLREAAYSRIPPDRRVLLHQRAALLLEGSGLEPADLHAAVASHHARARAHEQAYAGFVRGAEHARRTDANEQAVALYRAALREAEALSGPFPPGITPPEEQREHLGDLLAMLGHPEEARASYEKVLHALPAAGALGRARLHRKLGKSWEPQHRHEEALASFARAEACLGTTPGEGPPAAAWWREWVQLQIERISTHYWAANTVELEALIERAQPLVAARGTPLQRARFFQSLVQRNLRAERYAASAGTAGYARQSLLALQEDGDRVEVATARFTFAAVLLWHGALDEAEAEMRAAIDEAERLAHTPLQARCWTYLTMLQRQRQRTDAVQRLARKALKVAMACQMADYAAAAEANLGWGAWREGRLTDAEALCQSALARWMPLSLVFPFQWVARWPLLEMAHRRGESRAVLAHARALLESRQQKLPALTREALEHALENDSQGRREESAMAIESALEFARCLGHL